jgi:xanthine/uracil permease
VLSNGMAAGTVAAIIVNLVFTAVWARPGKKIQTT